MKVWTSLVIFHGHFQGSRIHLIPKTPLKATAEEASKSSEVGGNAGCSIKTKPGWPLRVRQATIKEILMDAEAETGAL